MKKINVIVTVEENPPNAKDLAEYLILLMDWEQRAKKQAG